tara:strand:+ start:8468 stop:10501 length:2034 start_codon:yes stop_codon:yes gene_type:complete
MANKNVGIRLTANIAEFQSKMKKVQKGFKKTSKSLKKVGSSMTLGLTLPMAAFAAASIKAFDTQAKAEAKLNTALKGNGKAFAELKTHAQELQKITLFGDEETMGAQAMLASMGLETEAIKKLTPLVQDLATAKGMNLTAAADMVAKSVGSSTNSMSRYGVEIEGAVGSSERLDSAVSSLSSMFEGQSKAAAKAGAGGLKQLQNTFGDLMEDVGGLLIPVLNKLVSFITGLVDSFSGLDKGTKVIIVTIGGILAVVGPLISLFGFLAGAIAAISWPIVAVVAGLAALTAAIMYVADNWTAIKEQANKAFAIVKNSLISLLQFFLKNNIFSWLIDGYNKVMQAFGKEGIKNPFEAIAEKLEDFKSDVPKAETEFKDFFTSIKNSAEGAAKAMGMVGQNMGVGTGGGGGGKPTRKQEQTITLTPTTGSSSTAAAPGLIPQGPPPEDGAGMVSQGMANLTQNMGNVSETIGQFANEWGGAVSGAFDLINTALDASQERLNQYYDTEQKRIEGSKMSEEQKQAALLKLEEEVAKKQAKINKKKAVAAKAQAIFQAVISTAGAIAQALPNIPLAVVVGAMGAMQVGAIAAAPLPAMENGGILPAGQPALVGEAGPEIFQPTSGGMVLPNSVLSGGLGKDVNVTGQLVVQGTDLVAALNNALEEEYGNLAQSVNTFGRRPSMY